MGGVLCLMEGEIVMYVAREDVQQAAEAEATIHAMYYLYQQDEVEAILLVDAENVFHSINRKYMLHIISCTYSIISTFISNCSLVSARLFVIVNKVVKYKEEATLWDPTAMGAYALGVTSLLHFLHEYISSPSKGRQKRSKHIGQCYKM